MEFGAATLGLYARRRAALATALVKLEDAAASSRKAKHRSLTGHARMARRIAALIPFYEYDETRFFRSDDAPDEVAARRRAGFMRLAELYRDALREDRRGAPPRPPTASPTCSSPTPIGCRSSSAASCAGTSRPARSCSRRPA